MKMNSKKAFTLIELLIVIAIIGILAVAFLPSLLGAPAKGRDAQRLAAVQKIQSFLVSESLVGGIASGVTTGCINSADAASTSATKIGGLINLNIADFGGTFPKDPQSANVTTGAVTACTAQYGFVKYASGAGYSYGVYAAMENVENANIKCTGVTATPPSGSLGAVTLASGEVGCYLALVQ